MTVRDAVGGTGVVGVLVVHERVLLVVVVDVETHTRRVDVAVAEDEHSAENGLCEKIEDTIENGCGSIVSVLNQTCDGLSLIHI